MNNTSDVSLVLLSLTHVSDTLLLKQTPSLTNNLKFYVVFLLLCMSGLVGDEQSSLYTVQQVNLDKWYTQKDGPFTKKRKRENEEMLYLSCVTKESSN